VAHQKSRVYSKNVIQKKSILFVAMLWTISL
jgi:hypothetical protein